MYKYAVYKDIQNSLIAFSDGFNHTITFSLEQWYSSSEISFIKMYSVSSDLGEGWSPAVIRSDVELEFIKKAMEDVDGPWSYWIGGSTTSAEEVTLDSYSASACSTTSSEIIVSLICHLFHRVYINDCLENWNFQT